MSAILNFRCRATCCSVGHSFVGFGILENQQFAFGISFLSVIQREIFQLPVSCPSYWISDVARHVILSVIIPLGSTSLETYSLHLELSFYLKHQGRCINFRFHVRHLEFRMLRDIKYSRTQLHWVDHPKNNIYCKIIVAFIISAKQYMRNSCSWCNFYLR